MSDEQKGLDWAEVRRHAQTRPAMYIGSQETGHKQAISSVLRLVWQAKAFRRPQAVTIDLSPTQYIVRAECGPLIKPIQDIFSFGTGTTLGENWREEFRTYWQRQETDILRHDWRYCFSGPTGPRLVEPSYPFILSYCGVWGLRANDGLWCEGWANGQPVSRPFLLEKTSPYGLLAAASLDPQWFLGLPFTEEDACSMADLSHSRFVGRRMHGPHPNYTRGEIITRWHPQDDLVNDKMLTADGLQELL